MFRNKNISKKLKLRLQNTIKDKTLTYASEPWILTMRDRTQINIFERKVYRRILGPVNDNKKENWRILSNTEIYAMVKKPTVTQTIRLNILRWFGNIQRMEENRIPKKCYIWIWKQQSWEVDQEIDNKMKWGRMEDYLVEKGGRKGYITERNGRSFWERLGIAAFCKCQWIECMNERV